MQITEPVPEARQRMKLRINDDSHTILAMNRPYDMHHHVRDGEILKLVVPMLSERFAGAIIMPNTDPPMLKADQVEQYHNRIYDAAKGDFNPLMTMYLSDQLEPNELMTSITDGYTFGVKFYPYGLTTNSEFGIKNTADLWTQGTRAHNILRTLSGLGSVLLLHAADGFDKNDVELDPYDQEPHFFAETLPRIRDEHPSLKISVEHLSTKEGVAYMEQHGDDRLLGCSVTPQHLLLDRRDVHRKGFNPDRFWWPIIQAAEHKEALLAFATAGHSFVWLGSDSAPHPITKKYASCCGGGVLTAHAGIELYAEAFARANALEKLEDFASLNGPQFYGVAPCQETIILMQDSWTVITDYLIPVPGEDPRNGIIRPFRMGEPIMWKLV